MQGEYAEALNWARRSFAHRPGASNLVLISAYALEYRGGTATGDGDAPDHARHDNFEPEAEYSITQAVPQTAAAKVSSGLWSGNRIGS
jgi:hypothetical protein